MLVEQVKTRALEVQVQGLSTLDRDLSGLVYIESSKILRATIDVGLTA